MNEATNKQTSFEAPDDVPLDELKDVILGENITTDIQPMDEYRQYRYSWDQDLLYGVL